MWTVLQALLHQESWSLSVRRMRQTESAIRILNVNKTKTKKKGTCHPSKKKFFKFENVCNEKFESHVPLFFFFIIKEKLYDHPVQLNFFFVLDFFYGVLF